MRKHSGRRYLSAREFGEYLGALGLRFSTSPEKLLEFLEREKLLFPRRRVTYPPTLVRKYWVEAHPYWADSSLSTSTDAELEAAVLEFDKRLHHWPHAKTHELHPLDDLREAEKVFVATDTDLSTSSFTPWKSFQAPMGRSGPEPDRGIYDDTVDTYYQPWQALLAIEIEGMTVRMLLNQLDEEILRSVTLREINRIRGDRFRLYLQRSVPDVTTTMQYGPSFEAVNYFTAYGKQALNQAPLTKVGSDSILTEQALIDYNARKRQLATQALSKSSITAEGLIQFLRWQVGRVNWWDGRDRQRLAGAYRQHVRETLDLYMTLTGKSYEEVVREVGRVDGAFNDSLEEVVPNWSTRQKRIALALLTDTALPYLATLSITDHAVTDADCNKMSNWLVSEEYFGVLWNFARISEASSLWYPVERAGAASAIEGLALQIEHMITSLMVAQGVVVKDKFMPNKIRWLWADKHPVAQAFQDNQHLTNAPVISGLQSMDHLGLVGDACRVSRFADLASHLI